MSLLVVRGGFLSSELAGLHFVGHTLARVYLWSGILQGVVSRGNIIFVLR